MFRPSARPLCALRAIREGLAEGLEGKQAELFEEIGVETDEAMNVCYAEAEKLTAKKRKL